MGWTFTTKLIRLQCFFYNNKMIEDLEADLTVSPKQNSNTEIVVLSKVANSDESITPKAKANNDV